MDDGARRWLFKTARKNYWRISRWYDLDDLIQEGYAIYYETVKRYPNATDPRHRMALFKIVFTTRVHDMANKRTRAIQEVLASEMQVNDEFGNRESFMERFAAEPGVEVSGRAFASAPKHVKDAMALFANDRDLARLRSAYRKVRVGKKRHLRRETLNERLCRLTGYDPAETDIVGGIRRALGFEKPTQVCVTRYVLQTEVVVERIVRGARRAEVVRVGGQMMACAQVGSSGNAI